MNLNFQTPNSGRWSCPNWNRRDRTKKCSKLYKWDRSKMYNNYRWCTIGSTPYKNKNTCSCSKTAYSKN